MKKTRAKAQLSKNLTIKRNKKLSAKKPTNKLTLTLKIFKILL